MEKEEEDDKKRAVTGSTEKVSELAEKLKIEQAKNRVTERNVKAQAVTITRRILAEEKRRKEKTFPSSLSKTTTKEEKTSSLVDEEETNGIGEGKCTTKSTKANANFEKNYKMRTEEMKRRKEARMQKNTQLDSSTAKICSKKSEWNDSFATKRLEHFPEAPARSPITIKELRRREKEK